MMSTDVVYPQFITVFMDSTFLDVVYHQSITVFTDSTFLSLNAVQLSGYLHTHSVIIPKKLLGCQDMSLLNGTCKI